MKRSLMIGLVVLTAGGCQMPSGLTTPTTSSVPDRASFSAAAAACPTPTPTATPSLPFAVFGHPQAVQAQGCPTPPPPPDVIAPSFSVSPQSGVAPLNNVTFDMCGSTDTDPAITLHYAANYGDGSPEDGSDKVCRFHHSYVNPGTFAVTECVWDEIPAHAPGACKSFTVAVSGPAGSCSFTILCTQNYQGDVNFEAMTSGSSAACGKPLTIRAVIGTQPAQTETQTCTTGDFCGFDFGFTTGGTATITSPNAAGTFVLPNNTFDQCGG
jgi:hypothetical protein